MAQPTSSRLNLTNAYHYPSKDIDVLIWPWMAQEVDIGGRNVLAARASERTKVVHTVFHMMLRSYVHFITSMTIPIPYFESSVLLQNKEDYRHNLRVVEGACRQQSGGTEQKWATE